MEKAGSFSAGGRSVFFPAAGSDPGMPIVASTGNQENGYYLYSSISRVSPIRDVVSVVFILYLSACFHPIMLFVFSKTPIPLALCTPHPSSSSSTQPCSSPRCSTKKKLELDPLSCWNEHSKTNTHTQKSGRAGYPRCAHSSVIQFYWDLEWFAPLSPREINTLINVILGKEVPRAPLFYPRGPPLFNKQKQNNNKKGSRRRQGT